MSPNGKEVHGTIRSTDATTAVEILIYESGTKNQIEIQGDEYLVITDLMAVYAAGGDLHVFVGDTATPGSGETVARGTVVASGGFGPGFVTTPRCGARGDKPYVITPDAAGAVDVNFTGRIRK